MAKTGVSPTVGWLFCCGLVYEPVEQARKHIEIIRRHLGDDTIQDSNDALEIAELLDRCSLHCPKEAEEAAAELRQKHPCPELIAYYAVAPEEPPALVPRQLAVAAE